MRTVSQMLDQTEADLRALRRRQRLCTATGFVLALLLALAAAALVIPVLTSAAEVCAMGFAGEGLLP